MLTTTAGGERPDYKFTAVPAPELEEPFRQTSGWIGADGDFSVEISKGRVIWLFSDTFVGEVRDNRRANWSMINNSVAVQRPGTKAPVEFFYGRNADGSPASFITPETGNGYFWLFHALLNAKGLYLFLMRTETFDPNSTFGFRGTGVALGHVTNPDDSPDRWKMSQTELKHCVYASEGSRFFGSCVLKHDGYAYVYGLDSTVHEGTKRRAAMVLARVPENEFGDQDAWRFLSGGEWKSAPAVPDALFEGMATEYSVSWLPGIEMFVAVYTEGGIWGRIAIRTAPSPEGPWSEPVVVYDCPDKEWHEKAFSYAVKAHPELATSPNELIVTYATNSTHFPDLIEDARLYWPRFVRVTVTR